jgi:UDP-GlcNAc:undecaprenyl-phosphate GlcNAc-1-phosphate transferase
MAGLTYAAYQDLPRTLTLVRPSVYWSMLAGTAVLFVLGLIDDLLGVGYAGKFSVQFVAAIAVWIAGFRIEVLALGSPTQMWHLGWLSLPLTVLWIVGVTNAVNLIDGLDGLAAGTALITTTGVAAIAIVSGQTGFVAMSASLVGALLGFLPYNFNPARIFLGDSGSMFLGFVLAVISIKSNQKGSTAVATLAPLLVIGFPILDTGLALIRRSWTIGHDGIRLGSVRYVAANLNRLFLPDRGHIHHRLLDIGLSQRKAVLTLYGLAALLAGVAFVDVISNSRFVGLLLAGVIAATVGSLAVMYHLARRQRARDLAVPPAASTVPVAGSVRHGG